MSESRCRDGLVESHGGLWDPAEVSRTEAGHAPCLSSSYAPSSMSSSKAELCRLAFFLSTNGTPGPSLKSTVLSLPENLREKNCPFSWEAVVTVTPCGL